jgi:hypothetical protein
MVNLQPILCRGDNHNELSLNERSLHILRHAWLRKTLVYIVTPHWWPDGTGRVTVKNK